MLLLALGCTDQAPTPWTPPAEDTGSTPSVEAELHEGDEVVCADPGARETRPFEILGGGPQWQGQSLASRDAWGGWGMAIADYDGDGHLDIFLPHREHDQLFMGNGDGTWDDETDARWPSDELDRGIAASAADYDGDGDVDILVGNWGMNGLYRNDDGVFTHVGESAGVSGPAWWTEHAAWGDMDSDGDLDLFVVNFWSPENHTGDDADSDENELYENLGDGTFADVTDRLGGIAQRGWTHAAGWHDMDADGDLDLYVVNDKPAIGMTAVVRLQVDGALVDDEGALGLNVAIAGMGFGAGDLNGDARPDFLLTGWGELALMESAEDGTWYDVAKSRGLVADTAANRFVAWGAELVDLDNDGDLDAPIAFGAQIEPDGSLSPGKQPNPEDQQDALFIQGDGGKFSEESAAWGVDDHGVKHGFVATDLDGDGWLDLVKRNLWGGTTIYKALCGSESWIGVRLRAPSPNTAAVGARVEVEAGGRTFRQWIHAGSTNCSTSGPPHAHIGLGDIEAIDVLRVWWPGGGTTEFEDVGVRRWVDVVRD